MVATLTSTDLDNDRCPRCGRGPAMTDAEFNKQASIIDAWVKSLPGDDDLRAEIERLRAALRRIAEFQSGDGDDADTCAKIAADAINEQETRETKP